MKQSKTEKFEVLNEEIAKQNVHFLSGRKLEDLTADQWESIAKLIAINLKLAELQNKMDKKMDKKKG